LRDTAGQEGIQMNSKEAVRMIEPNACVEKHSDGYLVLRRPEGRALGGGTTPARAWAAARMRLFAENIGKLVSDVPADEKDV
jgi:hypothetical protein